MNTDICKIACELIEALHCECAHHESLPNVKDWWEIGNHLGLAKDKLQTVKERMTVEEEAEKPLLAEVIRDALKATEEANKQVGRIDPTSLPWPEGVI